MKKLIIKFFDKIVVTLLGMLGLFTTCKQEPNCNATYFTDSYHSYDSLVVMYGMLKSDFEIIGKVTSKSSSKSIPGIRIIHHKSVKDIDSEANGGNFASQEVKVVITEKDYAESCGSDWSEIRYKKTQNI